jgi:hypothetical protein
MQTTARRNRLCPLLWSLTGVFALRVAMQPLALVVAQLPPFEAWHSAVVPYPVLLSSQLAILAAMIATNRACTRQALSPKPRLARALVIVGALYFIVMLVRLTLGFTLATPPAWFDRPLPTLFHLVLSIWLLLLSRVLSK